MATSNRIRMTSGLTVLVVSIVTITPVCGWLFACGCTWPGMGLDINCNIHDAHTLQACPWCASLTMGFISTSLAVLSGIAASMIPTLDFRSAPLTMVIRIFSGIIAFLLLSTVTGYFSAMLQNYPLSL